ncbi:MAG: histidine phosphatase family protein [Planctomycetaceae bacterium]|nr:histidine phosphatase family protein [Planctomycetaceae bacterium]
MPQILLVRPGQTDFDLQKRVQGSLDLPMNEVGYQEVQGLIQQLSGYPIDFILSGPNEPGQETAELLAEKLSVVHKTCEGLRNLGQGLWEGLEIDEVKRKFPSVYKHWEEAPHEVSIPHAEPVQEAIQRVEKVLKKYSRKASTVLIVANEPLATLVACVVEGRKLCLQKPPAARERCHVQILKSTP